ncbi:MAG: hypothetical protein ABI871_01920 [Chthoniobacterales bacterium]
MKARLIALTAAVFASQAGQALACSVCFGNYGPSGSGSPPPSVQHMAIAIWFMLAAVMSVLGGVGAFGIHLWRHANTPLAPHQQLAEEDLKPYE